MRILSNSTPYSEPQTPDYGQEREKMEKGTKFEEGIVFAKKPDKKDSCAGYKMRLYIL
jgi:hypothetical protein